MRAKADCATLRRSSLLLPYPALTCPRLKSGRARNRVRELTSRRLRLWDNESVKVINGTNPTQMDFELISMGAIQSKVTCEHGILLRGGIAVATFTWTTARCSGLPWSEHIIWQSSWPSIREL
jgi:hypothetical protein